MAAPSWIVKEKTTYFVRVSFFDEDGVPTTPEAAWYRVDDVPNSVRIVPDATSPSPSPTAEPSGMIPFPTPLASVMDIQIPAHQNVQVVQHDGSDERIMTVEFDYDGGKHGSDEYHYWVKGLKNVVP